jgi:hypothetical protein
VSARDGAGPASAATDSEARASDDLGEINSSEALAVPQPPRQARPPHFDEEGHFIHVCCKCGTHAAFGFGVNLRADKLGTWYCGEHKPTPKTISPERAPPRPQPGNSTIGGNQTKEHSNEHSNDRETGESDE